MLQVNRRLVLYLLLVLIWLFTMNSAIITFRTVRRLRQRPDEPIQPWMNISYIAHAYRVPNAVVAEAIAIDDRQRDGRPIHTIAQQQGVPVSTLIVRIMAAIAQFRPPHAPPGAPSP